MPRPKSLFSFDMDDWCVVKEPQGVNHESHLLDRQTMAYSNGKLPPNDYLSSNGRATMETTSGESPVLSNTTNAHGLFSVFEVTILGLR